AGIALLVRQVPGGVDDGEAGRAEPFGEPGGGDEGLVHPPTVAPGRRGRQLPRNASSSGPVGGSAPARVQAIAPAATASSSTARRSAAEAASVGPTRPRRKSPQS